MKSNLRTGTIPGTLLDSEKLGGVTGAEFIEKVFYVTDGIMLSQIREITGIDGTTLQNWLRRGWVPNPTKKTYSRDQLARILLINMMRDTLKLSDIISLLAYVNGENETVSECALYDIVCRVLTAVSESEGGIGGLDDMIIGILADESFPSDDKKRVLFAVRVIVISYYATTMKSTAEFMLSALGLQGEDGENGK